MDNAKKKIDECRLHDDLAFKAASGVRLDSREVDFLQRHENACGLCRLERSLKEVLRHRDGEGLEGPCGLMDDMSRRRIIAGAVEAGNVERAGWMNQDMAVEGRVHVTGAAAGRIRYIALAAAVCLVMVTGAVVWYMWGREKGRSATDVTSSSEVGRVVLGSGEAKAGEADPFVGKEVQEGSLLKVGDGRLGISFPRGAGVLLDSDTVVSVERLSGGRVALKLEQGRILVSVAPRKGQGHFKVETRAGTVTVTGTVFSVSSDETSVEVAVANGQVMIEEPGSAARRVNRGEYSSLAKGGGETRMMTESENDRLVQEARSIEMVSEPESATLFVTSNPPGAMVTVDGLALGRTPVEAIVRAGHRRVKIAMEGRPAVNELLSLEPGSSVRREFDIEHGEVALAPEGDDDSEHDDTEETSGEVAVHTDPVRRRPVRSVPGPKELLSRAMEQRALRDWRKTAEIYQELIRRFPKSREAMTASVALGVLLLDHLGKPADALKRFDDYLGSTKHGVLAQEAAYGRIRAFRRLGRTGEEIKALENFLSAYPQAPQRMLVQRRYDELRSFDANE